MTTGEGTARAADSADSAALHRSRADLRLVPGAAAAWLAAIGALGGGSPRWWLAGSALAATAGLALVVWHRATWMVTAGVVALCAACAGASAGLRVAAVHQGPVPSLAARGASADAELIVTGDPQRRQAAPTGAGRARSFVMLTARVEAVRVHGRRVLVRSPVLVFATSGTWLSLLPSMRVRAVGRFQLGERGQPTVAVMSSRGPPRILRGPSTTQRLAQRFRQGLRDAVSGLPANQRGLVPGLVLGDTSQMPTDLVDAFRVAGLTHMTAVSGSNLAILLTVVLSVARWSGLGGWVLPAVGTFVIIGFVVLVRPQPSVLRAAAMGLVAVLALAGGRRRQGLPALCAVVFLLVLFDPWLARSYGFALSVLATGGILVLAPGWRARLARHLPEPFATALAVPVAAQVACAPVIVMLSQQVSLVAVPANLAAGIAVPPATVLGVLATVTAPVAPAVAASFGWAAGQPAHWIVIVALRAAALPSAAVHWPGGVAGALGLAAASVVVTLGLRRVGRFRVLLTAVSLAFVVATSPISPLPGLSTPWPPPDWAMVACDVGQGDAIVLSVGPGTAVVIDAGPDPRLVDGCLRALGVRRIPLVLLTHFHADHVEGLPGVLRGRAVAQVEVGPLNDPPEEAARVRRWAAAAHVSVVVGAVGERRAVGPLAWSLLWPSQLITNEGSAPNNASLVVYAQRQGVRMLLTGDIEPPAQTALLHAHPALRAEILKVPHHGSAFQDPALVRAVAPRVAVISVGRHNDYGHPAPSTLALLRSAGVPVARTDENGDIAIAGPPQHLRVVLRRGRALAPATETRPAAMAPTARGPKQARQWPTRGERNQQETPMVAVSWSGHPSGRRGRLDRPGGHPPLRLVLPGRRVSVAARPFAAVSALAPGSRGQPGAGASGLGAAACPACPRGPPLSCRWFVTC